MAIHAIVLRTGDVLYYDTVVDPDGTNRGAAHLFNPTTGKTRPVPPPPLENGRVPDIWCGGQSLLPDGRVLVTGGTLAYKPFRGLRNV